MKPINGESGSFRNNKEKRKLWDGEKKQGEKEMKKERQEMAVCSFGINIHVFLYFI